MYNFYGVGGVNFQVISSLCEKCNFKKISNNGLISQYRNNIQISHWWLSCTNASKFKIRENYFKKMIWGYILNGVSNVALLRYYTIYSFLKCSSLIHIRKYTHLEKLLFLTIWSILNTAIPIQSSCQSYLITNGMRFKCPILMHITHYILRYFRLNASSQTEST